MAEQMFEIGKVYVFTMGEADAEGSRTIDWLNCKILDVNLPLVKVDRDGDELTINTASPEFVVNVINAASKKPPLDERLTRC
jgi:hypothetical protein